MRPELVSYARYLLDSHAYILDEAIQEVTALQGKDRALAQAQQRFAARAEPKALAEEQLYNLLDDEERELVKEYAEAILVRLSDGQRDEHGGFFPLMQKLGLAGGSRRVTDTDTTRRRPGLCKCVSFIVCHKKCCVGGKGRGAGAGLWGCNHTVCDGCP